MLAIDLTPVADLDHRDAQQLILNLRDNPVVANAILLVGTKFVASERLSDASWISERSYPSMKKQ